MKSQELTNYCFNKLYIILTKNGSNDADFSNMISTITYSMVFLGPRAPETCISSLTYIIWGKTSRYTYLKIVFLLKR